MYLSVSASTNDSMLSSRCTGTRLTSEIVALREKASHQVTSERAGSERGKDDAQARLGDAVPDPVDEHGPADVLPLAVARQAPHVEDALDRLGAADLAAVGRAHADGRAARGAAASRAREERRQVRVRERLGRRSTQR